MPQQSLQRSTSQEKSVSLEESRKKFDFGTLQRIAAEGAEYHRLKEIAKEHTNALNRQNTQLKNAIKAVLKVEDLMPEDEVWYDDTAYRFDYASSEKLPTEEILKLFEQKKITRDQFLGSISVNKADAVRLIGSFQVEKLLVKEKGNKADVRTRDLTPTEKAKAVAPVIIRAKADHTTVSPKVKPKPKILAKPGARLAPVRKLRKAGAPKW
jgi:hypothetical protein